MSLSTNGRKGSEAGPTHILVVRGLDEHVNEDMLHAEFSKYAPLKVCSCSTNIMACFL